MINQDEVAMSAWRVHCTGLHRPLDSPIGMVSVKVRIRINMEG